MVVGNSFGLVVILLARRLLAQDWIRFGPAQVARLVSGEPVARKSFFPTTRCESRDPLASTMLLTCWKTYWSIACCVV